MNLKKIVKSGLLWLLIVCLVIPGLTFAQGGDDDDFQLPPPFFGESFECKVFNGVEVYDDHCMIVSNVIVVINADGDQQVLFFEEEIFMDTTTVYVIVDDRLEDGQEQIGIEEVFFFFPIATISAPVDGADFYIRNNFVLIDYENLSSIANLQYVNINFIDSTDWLPRLWYDTLDKDAKDYLDPIDFQDQVLFFKQDDPDFLVEQLMSIYASTQSQVYPAQNW